MKRVILKAAVLLLRVIYVPMKWLPVKRKVAFLSRQSDALTIDIRLLSSYLQEVYPQLECRILARFIGPGIAGKLRYLPHMFRQMYHLATSRVVVLDGYCITASVLRHKPKTVILQMWHAITAIKKFGYQTIDQPAGHSRMVAETLCMHRNYDHVLCSSEATGKLFCEAFRVPEEKLLYMGLPRLDLITAPQTAEAAETADRLRESLRIPPGKELLLYVPTFRKGSPVDLKQLIASVDPERFVLAVRLHPLELAAQSIQKEDECIASGQVIFSRSAATEDWIRACDRIITDYSALSVEAALTGKPLYFYIYDISEYERSVGLNVDPRKEMPGATAVTGEQLRDLLTRPYPQEELDRFREKYITVDTKGCTARLGDYIYGIAQEIH